MGDHQTQRINQIFAEPRVIKVSKESGTIYLKNPYQLPQYARCIGDWLVEWAAKKPDEIFLAERSCEHNGWNEITYSSALQRVTEIAGWLLKSNADETHPIAILAENSIDHALLALAGMHIGVPVATISTAYSLQSSDFLNLKAMIDILDPGVIFVSDDKIYEQALKAFSSNHAAQLITSKKARESDIEIARFADAACLDNLKEVQEKFTTIQPDTTARLLFTSGSTGTPKAVINTHRMLTSNQEANRVLWPFLKDTSPIIVDWLPWSHTFGANFTMNLVLRNGGTMYIDDGKPAPPLIHKTVQNIKDVRPNLCFNVPRGYQMLCDELERDQEFAKVFFSMELIFYAAAALPKNTWDKLIELSVKVSGKVTPLVAAWGSTETAPLATSCHFQAGTTGNIGLPIPGVEIKLVPNGNKHEVRVKGPNTTPGYFKLDQKTRSAFDDEGYYIMGDAVRFADPDKPEKGMYFDGRVSEDFKLSSGTWVNVGALRIAGIDALSPLAQDIVVTGHDSQSVGFLIFPNEQACRALAGLAHDAPLARVLENEAVIAKISKGLAMLKRTGVGSSRYAARARFLLHPPNADQGEITDKAYLNQRQVLENRQADIQFLNGEDTKEFITSARN